MIMLYARHDPSEGGANGPVLQVKSLRLDEIICPESPDTTDGPSVKILNQ